MIEEFSQLGLSISKDRWLQISTSLGNASIDTFEQNGVVVPLYLEKKLFCTSAIDNIDINPKAVHAKGSLHGTAASINVHPVIESGVEQERAALLSDVKKLKQFPDYYMDIAPLQLPDVTPPKVEYDAKTQIFFPSGFCFLE